MIKNFTMKTCRVDVGHYSEYKWERSSEFLNSCKIFSEILPCEVILFILFPLSFSRIAPTLQLNNASIFTSVLVLSTLAAAGTVAPHLVTFSIPLEKQMSYILNWANTFEV